MVKIHEFTLSGAKVAVYPMRDVRSVRIELLIKAGSWYEKGAYWGAFHFLEHATYHQTRAFPDEISLELFKEKYGIQNNAGTGSSNMGYWFDFPETSLKEGFQLLEELVFKPTIPEKYFDRERKIIRQEYIDKWSDPYNRFYKAQDHQVFGKNHLYSRDGIGKPDYVDTVSREHLIRLHEKYFQPSEMVIAVAGKITLDESKKFLEKVLKKYQNHKHTDLVFPPTKSRANYYWHKEDVDQVLISLSYLTPGRNDLPLPERIKFYLAGYLIGGSARSLLFRKLRLEMGIIYKTGARWWNMPTLGGFEAWCSTSPKDASLALTSLKKVVDEFVKRKISEEDFQRAKNYINARTLMSYDSPEEISRNLAGDLFWEGKTISPEEYIALNNKIKPHQVQEILANCLKEKKKQFLAVMSRKDPKLDF